MSWLSQVQVVVHQLADVVRPCFGPHGLDHLLLSPSHSILITNASSTILSSLTPSHPIASLLQHQLRSTSTLTGDGTATLLLLLEAAIHHTTHLFLTHHGVHVHPHGTTTDHDRARYAQAMHGLLAGLAEVEREWVGGRADGGETGLMELMRGLGREVAAGHASMVDACRQLLTTQLGTLRTHIHARGVPFFPGCCSAHRRCRVLCRRAVQQRGHGCHRAAHGGLHPPQPHGSRRPRRSHLHTPPLTSAYARRR